MQTWEHEVDLKTIQQADLFCQCFSLLLTLFFLEWCWRYHWLSQGCFCLLISSILQSNCSPCHVMKDQIAICILIVYACDNSCLWTVDYMTCKVNLQIHMPGMCSQESHGFYSTSSEPIKVYVLKDLQAQQFPCLYLAIRRALWNALQHKWTIDIVEECKAQSDCSVRTLAGRVRYLPKIKENDRNWASEAERKARNTVPQGSAADIAKIAMIRMHTEIQAKMPEKCNIVLMVSATDIFFNLRECLHPFTYSVVSGAF